MTNVPVSIEMIRPEWPAPATVAALCTTRGGDGGGVFGAFNLGDHVGDEPDAVAVNRRALIDACPGLSAISWLRQVHGTTVVTAMSGEPQEADAQYTSQAELGCAVMTADCLPVLFCNHSGTQVAAAHAGWRGLCAGILENTVATFAPGDALLAWLGPAIGPANFEVGPEVRAAFLAHNAIDASAIAACFRPSVRPEHYLADIYALARLRLQGVGVTAVYGGGFDTVADSTRFYSYRRDGITGRQASLIYIMPTESGV